MKYISVSDRPFLVTYALALSSIIYILLPNVYHSDLLWSVSPFLMLIPSIIVTSWYGGLLPGLFATAVGIIVGDYFFTHPFYTFIITDIPDLIRVILFGIIGVLISILSQLLHNALAKAREETMQQKHAAILLKEQDKQKSTFLNVVAHELKTPITIIRILTYRIMEQYKKSVEKETLQEMDGELERLTILVDDLLDISRIEKGKLLIEKKKINIARLIQQVVIRMQEISPQHRIIYSFQKNVFIVVDELRIKQVLINLLANAIKHSQKQTSITVQLYETKNDITISVKDEGIGIDQKEQPFIFDMFYQVQDYFTKGFGLGLYISKEIIQQHEGKIWVESKKGKGSTFYFSLPK